MTLAARLVPTKHAKKLSCQWPFLHKRVRIFAALIGLVGVQGTINAHHVKYPALSAVCNDIYLIRKSYSLQNKAMLICFKTKSLYSQRAVLSNVLFVQWRMH